MNENSASILAHEILFIINPNSGKGRAIKVIEKLKAIDPNINFVVTPNLEAAVKAFSTLDKKYKGVVIVGGDGTINEALPHLSKRNDIVMGALPFGSGNGFSIEMGFDKDIKGLLNSFRRGETIALDVLEINGEYAINVSGIGIDGFVAYHFQKSKRRGFVTYIFSTIKAIMQFKDFEARVSTPSKEYSGKYRMITIANTRQFGNNAVIAPEANPSDGRYDLVLVNPFPIWAYPKFIIKMFRGKLKSSKYIEYVTLEEDTKIEWAGDKYHLDGEPKSSIKDLNIRLEKGKILVIKR